MVVHRDFTRLLDKKELHYCLCCATSCLNQSQYGTCDISCGEKQKKKEDMLRKSIIIKFNFHISPSGRKRMDQSWWKVVKI